jgi:hypothetical protein
MPASPASHLKLIDEVTGEITEAACNGCAHKEDELQELFRKMRGLAAENAELKRDRQHEAESHKYWPIISRMFQLWQTECKHPKSEWNWQRFEMALPFVVGKKYGVEKCLRAIAGAAYDPWKKLQRNGIYSRRDGWDAIFGKPGEFESFCNRAPKDWVCPEIPGLWPQP